MYCITLCIHLILSPFPAFPIRIAPKHAGVRTRILVREPPVAGGAAGGRTDGDGDGTVARGRPGRSSGEATHCGTAPAHAACTRKTTSARPACRVTAAGDRTGARIVSCVLCVAYAMSERAHPAGPHQGAVQCTGAAKQRPLQTRLSASTTQNQSGRCFVSGGVGERKDAFFLSRVCCVAPSILTRESKDVDRRRTIWRARCQLTKPTDMRWAGLED